MKTTTKHIILILTSLMLLACGGGQRGNNNTTQLTDIFIYAPAGYRAPTTGEFFQLKATGIFGNAGENRDITTEVKWLSDNTTVATVLNDGRMHTLNEGFVTVNAQLNNISGKLAFNVTLPPLITDVEVKKMEGGFFVDEKKTLTITANAQFSNKTHKENNALFSWSTSEKHIATIDQNGTITGISFGKTTITAIAKENPKIRASILLTVKPVIIGITLPSTTSYLSSGEKKYAIASFSMSDGSQTFAPTKIQWQYTPENSSTRISPTGEILSRESGVTIATASYQTYSTDHKLIIEPPLTLFVTQDSFEVTTVSWQPKRDIEKYTIIINNDNNSSIEYSSDTLSHSQIKDSSNPESFQLLSTRTNGSTELSEKIVIQQSTGVWQKITNMKLARFPASTRNNERIYFFGGEISDQNNSQPTNDAWSYNLSNKHWEKETSLESPLSHAAACTLNNTLYIFGGINLARETLSSVHAYDPEINTWKTDIAILPKPLFNLQCITSNEDIYISGGVSESGISTATYSYNPAENSWNLSLPSLNTGRSQHAMLKLSNLLYAAGGNTNLETASTQIEVLDLNAESPFWSTIAEMNIARSNFSIHQWDNKLHAIGGNDSEGNPLSSKETYYPTEGLWRSQTPVPFPITQYTSTIESRTLHIIGVITDSFDEATGLPHHLTYDIDTGFWSNTSFNSAAKEAFSSNALNNQLFIIGGSRNTKETNDVSIYNPQNKTWRSTNALPTAKKSATSQVITTNGIDDLYVFGGHLDGENLKTAHKYSSNDKLWREIVSMNSARAHASSAKINSKIYIFGGNDNEGISNTFEIYDSKDQTWTIEKPMDKARSHASSAILHGKIYLIGGRVDGTVTGSVSIYNPATSRWSDTANNLQIRRELAGSAVFNNKIYIIGGLDSESTPLNSIEFFTGAPAINNETPTWKTSNFALPSEGGIIDANILNGKLTLISQEKTANLLENYIYILE